MLGLEIDAREFGLTGQNAKKDTTALQKALNFAKKHFGTTINVPNGEYYIKKALVIYAGTTLKLENNTVLKRQGKDALIKNGKRPHRYYGYNGNSYITITGGTLDMNGKLKPVNNTAMCIGHAREITISRDLCWFAQHDMSDFKAILCDSENGRQLPIEERNPKM